MSQTGPLYPNLQEAEQFRQALAQARQEAAQEAGRFFTWE